MSARVVIFLTAVLTLNVIVSTNGQCTTEWCANVDPSMNILAEIQQQSAEASDLLNMQVQSVRELLVASLQQLTSQYDTLLRSLQTVERLSEEQGIDIKQIQRTHDHFNESLQEIKDRHGTAIRPTSLQAADQSLQEHDIKNRTRNSGDLATDICSPTSELCDCSYIRAKGQTANGVYEVCVGRQPNRTCSNAYCYMDASNGSSLVFQRRRDGRVDFNRTWADYKQGFGDRNGEFWLGNEMLHLLTSKRNYKLLVDLEDFSGNKVSAEYTRFSISSPASNYTITISGYSGNAGDAMTYNNKRQFSTYDVNSAGSNCAQRLGGGWWYGGCSNALLNGRYHHTHETVQSEMGILWYHWHFSWTDSLKATEMKLVSVT